MAHTPTFWDVYNYIAAQWYATEYGQVEDVNRWYQPAMIFLERRAMPAASTARFNSFDCPAAPLEES